MAKLNDLSSRLLQRFKDVPGVEQDDTESWIESAMNEHGYDKNGDVPLDLVSLVMLYAEADGASQVALRASYYFMYSDKDETVDKTAVADHYRKMADILWDRYNRKRVNSPDYGGGSSFKIMTRADR